MIIKPRRVGDVITHKNGQRMVIFSILDVDTFECVWFDPFDKYQTGRFFESSFENGRVSADGSAGCLENS